MNIYKISIPIYRFEGDNVPVVSRKALFIASEKSPTKEQVIQVLRDRDKEDSEEKDWYKGEWRNCLETLNRTKDFPRLKDHEWCADVLYQSVYIYKGLISVERLRVSVVG